MSKIVADNISPRGSDVTIAGVGTFSSSGVNLTGIVTASSGFVGNVTGDATGLSGSPTLSGITSVSTTNLTVNGNAYPAAGPLSNRNLIINGSMQVAQRGTSSTADGYIVDRFATYSGGGVSITQSQEVLTSGGPYDEGFRYFLRNTNTSATANTNSYSQIQQQIEAQNMAQSAWDYTNSNSFITCSFWARSSLSGTYYVQYRDQDGSGNYQLVKSFTLNADTWTKVTHTLPGEASVVFNNDNGSGLQFTLLPHYGSDFTSSGSTVDAWYTRTSTTWAPDFPQNWNNTASATFDLTGVQLEVGSVATPFEHRSYGDELLRCCRYFFAHNSADTYNMVAHGHYGSSSLFIGMTVTPVPFRDIPSISVTGNWQCAGDSASVDASNIRLNDIASGNNILQIRADCTGASSGEGTFLRNNNDATATCHFSSEL